MADRRAENIRRALEAEGASREEIVYALAELDAPDPLDRARAAGIPALYRGVSWESITEDEESRGEAIDAARRFAAGEASESGLYLWSDGEEAGEAYGVGKTRIAAAAASEILSGGSRSVRWLDVVQLMTDLNLPFKNPLYERAAAKLQPPGPREAVVLDDVDKLPPTDRNIQPIFALVNGCVQEEAPLIITANRSLDDLSRDFGDRFGRAMASRLVGHCLDVEVVGRDRRLEP